MINRAVASVGAIVAVFLSGCGSDRSAETGSGPERRLIAGPCEECTVRFEEVAMLGGPDDPVAIRHDAATRDCMVGQSAGGEFFVSGLVGGEAVARYRPDGAFILTFGRGGQGPGELGSMLRIGVGAEDSIFVLDQSQGRAGVYDREGSFARSFPIPSVSRPWARSAEGAFVFVSESEVSDTSIALVVGRDGERRGGVPRPVPSEDPTPFDTWVVSASSDGGLWAASMWQYDLFHMDASGRVDLILERDAAWFPPGGRYEEGMWVTVEPLPLIRFIRELGSGLIMVVAVVPDERWVSGIAPEPGFEWGRRSFDTRVEVIDPSAARVVAATRTDEWLGAVCSDDLLYSVVEGRDLTLRMRILKPVL